MNRGAKPNIFPILRYQNARAAIDWLVRAFGFEAQAEHVAPDGTIAEAQVRFGSGVIGVISANVATGTSAWSLVRHGIFITVENPDVHHDRAKAEGAEIVAPPRYTTGHVLEARTRDREYLARDPDGHLWGFGTSDMGATSGQPNIFPEIRYRDASAAVTWLTNAFGFRPTRQIPGPDRTVAHAELQLGQSLIMVGGSMAGNSKWGDITQFLNVRLDDPDEHFARAKAAGATIIEEPKDTPYGARFYAARDPEQFLWWFSTYQPATVCGEVAESTI